MIAEALTTAIFRAVRASRHALCSETLGRAGQHHHRRAARSTFGKPEPCRSSGSLDHSAPSRAGRKEHGTFKSKPRSKNTGKPSVQIKRIYLSI